MGPGLPNPHWLRDPQNQPWPEIPKPPSSRPFKPPRLRVPRPPITPRHPCDGATQRRHCPVPAGFWVPPSSREPPAGRRRGRVGGAALTPRWGRARAALGPRSPLRDAAGSSARHDGDSAASASDVTSVPAAPSHARPRPKIETTPTSATPPALLPWALAPRSGHRRYCSSAAAPPPAPPNRDRTGATDPGPNRHHRTGVAEPGPNQGSNWSHRTGDRTGATEQGPTIATELNQCHRIRTKPVSPPQYQYQHHHSSTSTSIMTPA